MARQRAAAGAAHLLVDVAVVDAVEARDAEPADSVPPTTVATTRPSVGTPRAAKNITGTVVSSSSSMTRGLVSPTYAADDVAARSRACAARRLRVASHEVSTPQAAEAGIGRRGTRYWSPPASGPGVRHWCGVESSPRPE